MKIEKKEVTYKCDHCGNEFKAQVPFWVMDYEIFSTWTSEEPNRLKLRFTEQTEYYGETKYKPDICPSCTEKALKTVLERLRMWREKNESTDVQKA